MVFFLEFLINDGVCLIYEGNSTPRHSSKSSLLNRESQCKDTRHRNACTGEVLVGTLPPRQRDLSYGKKKNLTCLMEYDQMLFNCADRQHALLEQINEFEFLMPGSSGWTLTKEPNGSMLIGGLRSPCMNAHHFMDHVDRVGRVLRSFDGVFEFEREKEFFYIEYNVHSLTFKSKIDLKDCHIVRLLAKMRRLLDNFGKSQNLPRSSVRVDEDFWYMHGENGCIDSSIQGGGGGWPNTSIFHNRSPVALQLNPMLSQSLHKLDNVNDSVAIENLKAMLFRDIRESREEFFNLR